MRCRPRASRIEAGADDVLVVFGDTPFISADSDRAAARGARAKARRSRSAACGPTDPTGYGRLLMDGDRLVAIREERDATEAERDDRLRQRRHHGARGRRRRSRSSTRSRTDNDQKEFYLTDAVEIANRRGLKAVAVEIAADEVFGINDRAQLAEAERHFQARRRAAAMAAARR